jgi:FAD/FMN-containing dehydrogenase
MVGSTVHQTVGTHEVRNWFGSVVTHPTIVTYPETVDEIISILRDHERYPSPVRAVGSNHSVSACDNGTMVVMRRMDRILHIGNDTVTVEAGALYIDVAHQLRKHNLQFYVNVEIGSLTIGSAACGGTKDASMPGEFGQCASFVTAAKIVSPAGEIVEITEKQPELLQVLRSSYGLLGIIYEVTLRVRPMRSMSVYHKIYRFDDFAAALPSLATKGESIMMYLDPFRDAVTVEFRRYRDDQDPSKASSWQWKLRNYVWGTAGPWFSGKVTKYIGFNPIRYFVINMFYRLILIVVAAALRGKNTVPTDQIIRYHDKATASGYIFSVWAFQEEGYLPKLRSYYEFCRKYYRQTGYRPNIMSVGYRIVKDNSSLFSYSYRGDVITFDPVFTGNPGFEKFLVAYNEFCSERDGVPLFNQTAFLSRAQVRKAFGDRIDIFAGYRRNFDPNGRLLSEYFRELL